MKILVVGTGAVGGFYGAKLTLAGEDVTFLARGKTLEVLQKQDLFVKSYQGDFHTRIKIIADLPKISSPDLILIAVKTYDTDTVLKQIAPIVGPHTLLVSFQNGVESEIKMAAAFGEDKVLGCVCYIGAEVVEPGLILHSARGSVAIGEMNGEVTERAKRIVDIFRKAKIDVQLSTQIKKDLWTKLAWNSAFNQVCTIARASVGEVLDSPELKELIRKIMEEVHGVAEKNGVQLDPEIIEASLRLSTDELRSVRPSMLQDLERGKRLEHESFAGFIVREGEKHQASVAIHSALYAFLCFLDRLHNANSNRY
jgi:2-dehydropantoate 2-reductase